jgi:hypothetical protein
MKQPRSKAILCASVDMAASHFADNIKLKDFSDLLHQLSVIVFSSVFPRSVIYANKPVKRLSVKIIDIKQWISA